MAKYSIFWYKYISDDGNTYQIEMNYTLATAVGALAVPVGTAFPTYPKSGRWRPRHIDLEFSSTQTDGSGVARPITKRKRLVVCDPALGLWIGTVDTLALPVPNVGQNTAGTTFSTSLNQTVATFVVTGRHGESRPNQSNRDEEFAVP